MSLEQHEIDAECERLAALRMQVLEMHPFWGYMLLQVRLVPALALTTLAATDAVRHIWFNPARTRLLSRAELGFMLVHEVCHQVLASTARQAGRESVKWNMAVDFAINAMVEAITMPGAPEWDNQLYQMPPGVLFNRKYRNWIAEVIYEELCRNKTIPAGAFVTLTLPDARGENLDLPDVLDHHGGIDVHVSMPEEGESRELLRERILAAVENFHAHDARGNVPEEMLRQTGLLEPPKIPWRRLLHHYADTALHADDYSLVRPNKHYWAQDLVVPGCYSETLGSVVVALDTSGSMGEEELREVVGEIRGIVQNTQDATLIVADCRIKQVVTFDAIDDFLACGVMRGGGGTDHVCVFDYIAEHRLNPRLFIGLSDLYSCYPDRQPPYPVLWIAPEEHGEPPWGKVISL